MTIILYFTTYYIVLPEPALPFDIVEYVRIDFVSLAIFSIPTIILVANLVQQSSVSFFLDPLHPLIHILSFLHSLFNLCSHTPIHLCHVSEIG